MADSKERIDVLLVDKGIFPSRERARGSIMAGEIFVDGIRVDKCGEKVKVTSNIEFRGDVLPYVSRGGLKLEKAIKAFNLELKNKVCLDIGASTGGFTDCMLQKAASKVYAIDVGYGQFAWKLRVDPRVVCMERTNVRYVKSEDIGQKCDFASIDVSFISLKKVIPPVLELLKEQGEVVALIKPQFEAGKEKVGKKGVVREASTHKEVILSILEFLISKDMVILDLNYSPVKGPEGNIEYLVYFSKNKDIKTNFELSKVEEIVAGSHMNL